MVKKLRKNTKDYFEIKFYEGILAKSGNFIEALSALGDLYTKNEFYQKGLQIDKKLAELKKDDSVVLYNLACSYSLLNEIDNALVTIKRAIKCGYEDFNYIKRDNDLLNLRQDERFKKYFTRLQKRNLRGKKTTTLFH